ncbi:MAG: LD-carboxypeptidase [Myxococcales bacterium]|nr:LD-carboxypeptidase [Myxococcales bacterium]
MVRPPALRPGDLIGVCAPAGPVNPERLAAGVARLERHFRVRVPPGLDARAGYLAGPDARRADELAALLADPEVRGIVCARGGYGVTRMLAAVDPAPLAADPRPVVGFSDVTALLAWAAAAGVAPIHGPMVCQLGELPEDDVAWLVRLLTDPRPAGRLPWRLAPVGAAAPATAVTAPLLVGNLTLLAHLVGTPWQLDAAGCVLVIEEVSEKPYAIDRDLTQLGHAGALRGCRGLVLGDLTRCTDPALAPGAPDDPGPARSAVIDRLLAFDLPGLAGAPVGHGARNAALPFGGRATVDFAAGTVELLDAAVR